MQEEKSFDFLKKKYQLAPKREDVKRERGGFRVFVVALLSVACAGFVFSLHAQGPSRAQDNESSFGMFNPLLRVFDAIGGGNESDDRINILLLGIGGAGHDGPELTDTIMIASIQPSTKEVAMLSIPRDLMVQAPGYGARKINSINAIAESRNRGSGPEVTKQVIEDIFGEEIDYYVKIDFKSFEYLIDSVGGVNIHVDRSFSDPLYPTMQNGVQMLTFEKGWQRMDGKTALKFSRSRHGNNGEGSDFARAARQQKVITAVKDELLSKSTIFNPGRLNQLAQLAAKNVNTDMGILDMVRLAKYALEISSNNTKHFVLDDSPSGPLYSSTVSGAYVLLPKKEDWSELRYLLGNIFEEDASVVSKPKTLQAPTQETRIEIQNGTLIGGLAAESASLLQNSGFTVTDVGNAPTRDVAETIIYDLTDGKKDVELRVLQEFFSAKIAQRAGGWLNSPQSVPDHLLTEEAFPNIEGVDFLVILGQDVEQLVLR